MYIRTVEIENYRAFKNFEIKLSPLSLIIAPLRRSRSREKPMNWRFAPPVHNPA